MTDSHPASGTPSDPSLRLARCGHCGGYSYPAGVYGCRVCGRADALAAVPLPGTPVLKNFVTVHAALAPGLPVPCVVGEVELAPGLVEEALIDGDEDALVVDMPLVATRASDVGPDGESAAAAGEAGSPSAGPLWRFTPVAADRATGDAR